MCCDREVPSRTFPKSSDESREICTIMESPLVYSHSFQSSAQTPSQIDNPLVDDARVWERRSKSRATFVAYLRVRPKWLSYPSPPPQRLANLCPVGRGRRVSVSRAQRPALKALCDKLRDLAPPQP